MLRDLATEYRLVQLPLKVSGLVTWVGWLREDPSQGESGDPRGTWPGRVATWARRDCTEWACHLLFHLKNSTRTELPLIATPKPAKDAKRTDRTAGRWTYDMHHKSFEQTRQWKGKKKLFGQLWFRFWNRPAFLPKSKIRELREPPRQTGKMHKPRRICSSLHGNIKEVKLESIVSNDDKLHPVIDFEIVKIQKVVTSKDSLLPYVHPSYVCWSSRRPTHGWWSNGR